MMYQEIIESEPDNTNTVKEFSQKIGIALKRNGTAHFIYA